MRLLKDLFAKNYICVLFFWQYCHFSTFFRIKKDAHSNFAKIGKLFSRWTPIFDLFVQFWIMSVPKQPPLKLKFAFLLSNMQCRAALNLFQSRKKRQAKKSRNISYDNIQKNTSKYIIHYSRYTMIYNMNAQYQAAVGPAKPRAAHGPARGMLGPRLGPGRLPLGILYVYCISLCCSNIFGYALFGFDLFGFTLLGFLEHFVMFYNMLSFVIAFYSKRM